jgi:hypothetical protein
MKKHDDDLKSVTVRLPVSLIERMERWGKRHGVTQRSDQMRMLLSEALNAAEVKAKAPALRDDLAARLADYQQAHGKSSTDDALNELLDMALDADEVERERSTPSTEPKPGIIGKIIGRKGK